MDSLLYRLQNWYHTQCKEDWHSVNGIDIRTVDKPGWEVEIDVLGTPLENKLFVPRKKLIDTTDWIQCWVDENIFYGSGDPGKLSAILEVFLQWVEE
jgi:hypothetical protein